MNAEIISIQLLPVEERMENHGDRMELTMRGHLIDAVTKTREIGQAVFGGAPWKVSKFVYRSVGLLDSDAITVATVERKQFNA